MDKADTIPLKNKKGSQPLRAAAVVGTSAN